MTAIRLGIVRPDRPAAVIATAEARVLTREFERRLGPIVLDLRVDGDPIDGWVDVATASWPTGIDVEIDAAELWATGLPPLTSLFGRTVDPAAAAVRRRMLGHLGLLPSTFDQATLDEVSSIPLRPTDLWLMLGAAERVDVDDPAIRAFTAATGAADQATLDAQFDRLVEPLADFESTGSALQCSLAAEQAWRRRAGELTDELARSEVEAVARLDELAGEVRVLREQIERLELDADPNPEP